MAEAFVAEAFADSDLTIRRDHPHRRGARLILRSIAIVPRDDDALDKRLRPVASLCRCRRRAMAFAGLSVFLPKAVGQYAAAPKGVNKSAVATHSRMKRRPIYECATQQNGYRFTRDVSNHVRFRSG
jgi:hypothetical protein